MLSVSSRSALSLSRLSTAIPRTRSLFRKDTVPGREISFLIPSNPSRISFVTNQTQRECLFHTVPNTTLISAIKTYPEAHPIPHIAMSSTTNSPADLTALEAEIASVKARLHELRLAGGPTEDAKKTLSELQKALGMARGAVSGREKKEKKEAGSKDNKEVAEGDKKKKERLLLKTAKARPSHYVKCSANHTPSFRGLAITVLLRPLAVPTLKP